MLPILILLACVDAKGPPPTESVPSYTSAQVSAVSASVDDDIGALVWVDWQQDADATVWVEYRFEGEAWSATPSRPVAAGPARQLVAGVPYGETAELRVVNDFGDGALAGDALTIDNAPLPGLVPLPESVDGDVSAWDPDTNYLFLSLVDADFGSWVFIVDREGRPVWAVESPYGRISLHSRVSLDGTDLLVDENSYWAIFDDGAASQVKRMKLDGTVVETVDTPGLHHPFTDLPDGSLVYTAAGRRSETLDRRSPDGSVTTVWDCKDLLEAVGDDGTCSSNTIWYNPADGHILNSLYSLETIVDVDIDAGVAVEWFGHTTDAWAFDPPESAFYWQHGGNITAAGTLLTSTEGEGGAHETVVREYRLDTASKTLVQVWSFGEGEGIYGDVMGEAHRLANGNTLHNLGSATRIREVTPDGVVVWDVNWRAETMGRSTPIADLYAFVE